MNEFALLLADNLYTLHYDLVNQKYIHGDYQEYSIYEQKKRVIHKASVRDRVVHRLIFNIFYDYFDTGFIHDSYSCRTGKGTHKARDRFRSFVNKVSRNYTKPCYILKFDIQKCFESVSHDILLALLRKYISDEKLFELIFKIVKSFLKGLPLGNLTSQLFINIYLNELDYYAKQVLMCKYYVRYADDIVVVGSNKDDLEKLYEEFESFLKKLNLTTHKKTVSSMHNGVDVLGIVFFQKYGKVRRNTERRRMAREEAREEM